MIRRFRALVPAYGFPCTLLLGAGLFLLGGRLGHAQPGPSAVDVAAAYTGEAVGVLDGGVERGVVYLDNVDLTATVHADPLIDWPGLTAFAYGLGNQGRAPSVRVGDAQGTSNIEAPGSWRLYEGWLQQTVGTRMSVLVGLYDLNAEFDVNRTGSLFLNSSHGIGAAFGQSGRNGPSIFPVTSLAGRVRVRVASTGYAQAAVLDGVPGRPSDPGGTKIHLDEEEGVLVAGETGAYLGASGANPGAIVDRGAAVESRGKIAVGGWIYSTRLPEWPTVNRPGSVERSGGSMGLYVLAEGLLVREPGTDAQGLSAFGRVGWADDRFSRFGVYTGAGVAYAGLFPGRSADRVGLAVAAAHNGEAYEAAQRRAGRPVAPAEWNVEATYEAVVTSWLTVTADVQYVVNPNTDPTISNAFLGGIRFVLAQ